MTEAEWLACTDPRRMWKLLRGSGKLSERKARLFAVACCRLAWEGVRGLHLSALAASERYADGAATEPELRAAHNALHAKLHWVIPARSWWGQWLAGVLSRMDTTHWANDDDFRPTPYDEAVLLAAQRKARRSAGRLISTALEHPELLWDGKLSTAAVAGLLREVFGLLPSRRDPQVAPAVLAWSGGTLARLAASIYDERDFSPARLAVLADAVEDAGCSQADLVAHLRGPGPHVRGCWAVDLLVGKE